MHGIPICAQVQAAVAAASNDDYDQDVDVTMPDVVLLVLAKAPCPGRVKTRLCPPATPRQAVRIAAASLLDALEAVQAVESAQPVVAITGDFADGESADELQSAANGLPLIRQRGETSVLVDRCRRTLLGPDVDALLGRALDGGWWILGLHDPVAATAVEPVPMSQVDTGTRTRKALQDSGLRISDAPILSDVDTIADAFAVADPVPASRFAAAVREVS